MDDSYMIGQMNTFMHRLSEQMSGWLGKRLPKLTDEWWRDLVYNNLSQLQRDNVDAKGITELKGLDLAALLRVFDRVSQNVRDYLFDSHVVAEKALGQIRVNLRDKR